MCRIAGMPGRSERKGPGRYLEADHPDIPLSGERFYRLARRKIERSFDVQWQWNTRVTGIVDTGNSVAVRSSEEIAPVDIAIDARGRLPFASPLVQCFVGEYVRADRPVFQPDTIRLMYFVTTPTVLF